MNISYQYIMNEFLNIKWLKHKGKVLPVSNNEVSRYKIKSLYFYLR